MLQAEAPCCEQGPLELSNRAIEYKLLDELLETYSMLFSHDFDITHTQQRLAERGAAPMAARPPPDAPAPGPAAVDDADREERFVWNSNLLSSLRSVEGAWATGCILPVVSGFLAMQPVLSAGPSKACMALIARRDWHRCGYRSGLPLVNDSPPPPAFLPTIVVRKLVAAAVTLPPGRGPSLGGMTYPLLVYELRYGGS
jgi:hypothetical protein